ncbi:MAG: hypothetical protein JSS66_14295 [Armatimonadetes bacterium]|nr:hypothetical protein [Armatimonadota bacterium]
MFVLAALLLATTGAVQEDLPALGTNLAPLSATSTQWPFVDAMKFSSGWQARQESGAALQPLDVDADGNVKSLKPGQFAEATMFEAGHAPVGTYTLIWEGKAEFGSGDGTELTALGDGKAELKTSTAGPLSLTLRKVDPSQPPRNVRLLLPGQAESDSVFHPVFSQRMSLYRVLRFAEWGRTDNSPLAKWSERPTTSQVSYRGSKGMPLEAMIDLANEKAAMAWFCVPHMADDEYVLNMANLIKSRLRSDLKFVVEYSNEPWNGSHNQAAWCAKQGKAAKLSDDDRIAGLHYYSQRSTEVFTSFEKVFGSTARFYRVLSVPRDDPKAANEIVGWNFAFRKADLMGVSCQFGSSIGAPANTEKLKSGGLDEVFSQLKGEVDGPFRDMVFSYASIAKQNRLRLVAYAGGQDLVATGEGEGDVALNSLFDEANRDSRIRDIYIQALKHWRSALGLLFVHSDDCGPYSKKDRRGTIEYQSQDPQTSFKNQALIQYGLFPDR